MPAGYDVMWGSLGSGDPGVGQSQRRLALYFGPRRPRRAGPHGGELRRPHRRLSDAGLPTPGSSVFSSGLSAFPDFISFFFVSGSFDATRSTPIN